MKIERIKKSLDACGVRHTLTIYNQICCDWCTDGRHYCVISDSYGAVYRKLKAFGVLSKERYLLNRYG